MASQSGEHIEMAQDLKFHQAGSQNWLNVTIFRATGAGTEVNRWEFVYRISSQHLSNFRRGIVY